ncbi:MAG: DUF1385 domain-containing protein [Dehalococcoidales bacterium]|nr:MAG: DUF1385 domain-containing protein [Dehalococcoidales bacterium]
MAEFYYGGQAVIEGVMMRGRKHTATVVRRPNGELIEDTQPVPSLYTGRLRSVPLLRGIIVLIETLVLGVKTLMYSANVSLEEEGEKAEGWWIWVTLALALVAAVAIFFLAPFFITDQIKIGSTVLFHVIEGVIRLGMFIAYLKLISLMPDIKRVFAYHGAEHKTVNAYEAGVPLEVEAVKEYSKAHVRCGSSFIFMVLVLAIIVFSLVGMAEPARWVELLSRIVLVPLIAALGYEIIYFGTRHARNPLIRAVLAPGLWLQSMTTREPDDDQIEVAIMALNRVMEAEQAEETPAEAAS